MGAARGSEEEQTQYARSEILRLLEIIYTFGYTFMFSVPKTKILVCSTPRQAKQTTMRLLMRCCTSLQQQIKSSCGLFWLLYSALTDHYAESF